MSPNTDKKEKGGGGEEEQEMKGQSPPPNKFIGSGGIPPTRSTHTAMAMPNLH